MGLGSIKKISPENTSYALIKNAFVSKNKNKKIVSIWGVAP